MERGTLLGGRYRLVARLGRGGMGEVWAADDQGLGRRVAIKIVLADLDADPALTARLRREARTAAALQHPGITVVHDIGEHDGHPYFVMELLEGTDFAALLAGSPDGLPVARAAALMAQAADALAYAHHKGVVHRDIKPANLMELAGGGVKICDFGISRYADATTHLTATGGVLGTPAYMAPEQYEGTPADARTDLYAFGCTLHALLTGRPPFTGPSPASLMRRHLLDPPPDLAALRPDIPSDLAHLVLHLLAKDPADRPASAARVADALRALPAFPHRRPDPPAFQAAPPTRPLTVPVERPQAALPPTKPYTEPPQPEPRPSSLTLEPAEGVQSPRPPRTGQPAPDGRSGGFRTVAVLEGHIGAVLTAGFSPDGAWLATGGDDGAVGLWDVASGRRVAMFREHVGAVFAVGFSPDGARLATSGDDRAVGLWDVASGRRVAMFREHVGAVFAVGFSPDGARLATSGDGGEVELRDVVSGRRTAVLKGHTARISALAFGPDGTTLATGSRDGTARVWDVASGRAIATFTGHTGAVFATVLSPDGTTLATSNDGGAVRVWDVASGRAVAALRGRTELAGTLTFSPDGTALATSRRDDRPVRLWDAATGRPIATFTGHITPVLAVAFSQDGATLATGGADKTVRLWNAATGRPIATRTAHSGPVLTTVFSPDGATLATVSVDGTARLWKLR